MIAENDDYLLISGLQHFAFCRRQWALIHIEKQWAENPLTAEGEIIHQRVHDVHNIDVRNGIITMRDLPIKSDRMRVSGCCDAVEFSPCDDGIVLFGRVGKWRVCPVEYKHGHKKINDCDRMQVTAQAMCLEEMFSCQISEGVLFYYETRSREYFRITDDLRNKVKASFEEMNSMYSRGYTPIVKQHKGCQNCSLYDICLPMIFSKKEAETVNNYIESYLCEDN